MKHVDKLLCVGLLCLIQSSIPGRAGDVAESLQSIHAIGREGQGNEAAMRAWKHISTLSPSALPELIVGLNDGSPVANNWIRMAIQTILDREGAASSLPALEIIGILSDRANASAARVQAFEVLQKLHPQIADSIEVVFLDDPALPLRRLSVARLLQQADDASGSDRGTAELIYEKALIYARDIDQVEAIVSALNNMGRDLTPADAFGFIQNWNIIGPFDNSGREGFETVFPPEKEVDFDASYQGKNGEVSWDAFVSKDTYGKVDINEAIAALKEVTAYACRDFYSDSEQPAELRLGCKNAWKIWFNGEYVFGRDEYHRAARIDQYVFPVKLRRGPNRILIKLCQNEQTESWTREWEFQFRICDPLGRPIVEAAHGQEDHQ